MFKNMKLSTKIASGFGILILVCAVLGYTGWSSLGKVGVKVELGDDANQMVKESLQGRQHEKNFMLRKDKQYLDNATTLIEEIRKQTAETIEKLKDENAKETVRQIGTQGENWYMALTEYVSLEDQKTLNDEEMVAKGRLAITEIENIRADQKAKLLDEMDKQRTTDVVKDRMEKADDANRLNKFVLDARRHEKNFILRGDQEYVDNVHKNVSEIIILCEDMKVRFNDAANDQQADNVINAVNGYQDAFDAYVSLVSDQKAEEEIMVASARELQDKANGLRQVQKEEMDSIMASSNTLMITLAIGGVISGILLAFFITRSIVKPISKVIEGLASGAEQVSAASGQVSSSSQQLAEGSSEAASSLEEISSSLEEMTSMTKQNSANAKQADDLSGETQSSAEKGSKAMVRMTEAIDKIKESSDETAKIIKTIDEIAFQTNLLALNAAVEAARAGEAGAGFAVVAEEVRNLAMRSAESAKTTSSLIEESQSNADSGVTVTKEIGEILKDIAQAAQKVKQLIGEVSAASEEQSEGINQVNTAVAQMDKVTQNSAANAEESASASEELSSQAADLNGMVEELSAIVGGSGNGGNGMRKTGKFIMHKPEHVVTEHHKALAAPRKTVEKDGTKVVKPDDVIPLDEEEFAEF